MAFTGVKKYDLSEHQTPKSKKRDMAALRGFSRWMRGLKALMTTQGDGRSEESAANNVSHQCDGREGRIDEREDGSDEGVKI